MKLHLPKLLYTALMSVFVLPVTANQTMTNIAPAGADYMLLEIGGGDQYNHPKDNVVQHTGDLTLESGDKLGHFDSSGNLIKYDNGDGCTVIQVTQKYNNSTVNTYNEYQGNNEFSNMVNITGTLTLNGTAQVSIGGQYKVQRRTDTVDADGNLVKTGTVSSYLDHYSALYADTVIVNGTGTGTHLQATAAVIKNLEVNSGNVSFHQDQYNGNGSFSALSTDYTSFKAVRIEDSLTLSGTANVTMGRTHSKHNNTTTSHIVNVFGSTKNAITITQEGGTFQAIGYSYAMSGMNITQSGGSMTFRDYLQFSGTKTNVIEQSGNASLTIGQLKGSMGSTFDISQSGSGSITLCYGTSLGSKNSVVNISQSGSGTITLGGGNKQHTYSGVKNYPTSYATNGTTYNISLTGSGTLHLYSRDNITPAITASNVEIGSDSSLVLDTGTKITTTELTVSSGATIDNNGLITVGTGTGGSTAGALYVTTGGTLSAVLDGTNAILNVGAIADSDTITEWTMDSGSTFGIGMTDTYFSTLTMVENNGEKQISFSNVLVATVASGSTVDADSFKCEYVVSDIAGMDPEHWEVKNATLTNNAAGNVVLSGTLAYNPWIIIDDGGTDNRNFTYDEDYLVGLKITDKDVTLSGNNTHTLGTEIDGVEVTLAHANALGDGSVTTKGESGLVTADGITANLPEAIQNSGDLTMQGQFKLDDSTAYTGEVDDTYVDVNNQEGDNGFKREGLTYQVVVNNGQDATLTVGDNTSVQVGTENLRLFVDGLAGKLNHETYYIRATGNGSEVSSQEILNVAAKGGITDVTVEMTEETGTLTANSDIEVNASAGTLITEAGANVTGSLSNTTINAAGGTIGATIENGSKVTVSGNDTTTLSGDNSYDGGTLIDGGSLLIENANSLGSGDVELANQGVLDLGNLAVTNNILVSGCTLKRAGALDANLTVSGELMLTDNTTANTLTLRDNGTIRSNPGTTLTVDNADVQTNGAASITANLTINNNGTITLNNGNVLNVTGSITLSGITTLRLNGQYAIGTALVTATEGLEAGNVQLDYDDKSVRLEQVGNSLVLILNFKQDSADTLAQGNWGIATASRAFVNTVRGQRNNTGCIANGRGTAWFSVLGAQNNMDGSDVSVQGAAVGADFRIKPAHMMGIAFGYTDGDVSPTGLSKVNQEGYYAAVYGEHTLATSTPTRSWVFDWVLAYGTTESKQNNLTWEQDSLQINARVSRHSRISDRLGVNAFAGLEYFATGSDTVDGTKTGSLQNVRGEIGVGVNYVLWGSADRSNSKAAQGHNSACRRLEVYGELSYFNDMVRHNPVVRMNGMSGDSSNPGRYGIEVQAGATYRINSRWSTSANYTFSAMEDSTEHRFNVGASMTF